VNPTRHGAWGLHADMSPVARLLRIGALYVVLLVAFVGLLVAAYAIPQARIVENAGQSANLLASEGIYPSSLGTSGLMRDNFDDALMIDTAIAGAGQNAFTNAMLGEHQAESGPSYTIEALRQSVAGLRTRPVAYSYYWHGYQVLLRPALFFFSLGDIRYLNMLLMGLAALGCAVSVQQALGTRGFMAFGAALLLTGFYVVPLSLNFSSSAYIMFAAIAAALELERRGLFVKVSWEFWFVVGALTAFFDLFTVPLLTIGMPLVAILLYRAERAGLTARRALMITLASGAVWTAGYAASWSAKWMIGTVALQHNVLADAVESIAIRTGAIGGTPIVAALYHNIRYLLPLLRLDSSGALQGGWSTALLIVCVLLGAVTLCVLAFVRNDRSRGLARRLSPALIPAVLPFLWILLVSEHTNVHMWFTYRILAVPLFAVFAVLFACVRSWNPSDS
jgi:hypothetical protein